MLREKTRSDSMTRGGLFFDRNRWRIDELELPDNWLEFALRFPPVTHTVSTGNYRLPITEVINATLPTEVWNFDEIEDQEMIEYDIVVRLPPKARYTVTLEVKSIRKAEPKIVAPDWM